MHSCEDGGLICQKAGTRAWCPWFSSCTLITTINFLSKILQMVFHFSPYNVVGVCLGLFWLQKGQIVENVCILPETDNSCKSADAWMLVELSKRWLHDFGYLRSYLVLETAWSPKTMVYWPRIHPTGLRGVARITYFACGKHIISAALWGGRMMFWL